MEFDWVARIFLGGLSLMTLMAISLYGIMNLTLKFINRKKIKISKRLMK